MEENAMGEVEVEEGGGGGAEGMEVGVGVGDVSVEIGDPNDESFHQLRNDQQPQLADVDLTEGESSENGNKSTSSQSSAMDSSAINNNNRGWRGRGWSYSPEKPFYRNPDLMEKAFQTLRTYQRNRQLCDVILIAGAGPEERAEAEAAEGGDEQQTEIHAHRAILGACSPYFCAMFTAEMAEARQKRIYIQGVNPRALSILIDYMYTSEVHINEDNVQILLPAASLLQLTEVRGACCEFLKAQLHPTNCLGIGAFADLHGCDQLLSYANTFTEQHFGETVHSEEFGNLRADQVSSLISSDRLTTPGEDKVFEAVMHWVRVEPERRYSELPNLMEHVRLPLLSREYLIDKLDSEPLIMNCSKSKNYVIEAMKFHLLQGEQKTEFKSPRAKPRQPLGLPKLMVVIGGQAPKAIRNVDVYDFHGEKWFSVAELPQRRCRCGVAVLNGSVYAVGGFNGSLRVRTVDVYDPICENWTAGPAMEARRSTLGVAVVGGRIFAVGGFDGSTGLKSTEALDPRSGEWNMTAEMSTRRSSVGVGVLDGCLYAVGGYDGQSRQCLSTVEKYETRMDRWMNIAEMTTRRSLRVLLFVGGAGVTVIDGKLYAVGGHDGPMVKKSAEAFDLAALSWKPISEMSLCRRNAGVISLNGSLYAVGGDDGSSNLVSVEVYRPPTDDWTMLPHCMQIGRSYAGVAVINKSLT